MAVAIQVLFGRAAGALAQQDVIDTIHVDGPSVSVAVPISDPAPCNAHVRDGSGDWPPVCVLVTSIADDTGSAPFALSATLVHDPSQAYYDADEDLVHPYSGEFVWHNDNNAVRTPVGKASVELTATKEGHEAGVLSITLNGLDQVPVGTTFKVEIVTADQP